MRAQYDHSQGQAHAQDDQHGTVKKSCPRLDRGLNFASFFVAHLLLLARPHNCNVNAGRWGQVPFALRRRSETLG